MISELGTRCRRSQCCFRMEPEAPPVTLIAKPSPIHKRALELIKVYSVDQHLEFGVSIIDQ